MESIPTTSPYVSVNTRHVQGSGKSLVFVDKINERPGAVEVVCSSARRRMDHYASHTSYRLFSHSLTLDPTTVSTWPQTTDVCCWHCCHPFDTVPISIPRIISQMERSSYYEVYGVFCSVNCAKKFVLERKSYDQQQVLLQLNEMCSSVFGMHPNDVFTAKEAPPCFFLKMFGGEMDIATFRAKSLTTRTALVMPPFVSHAMILESHNAKTNREGDEQDNTEEKSDAVIEPLREGQHMLRGLRRPTRPVTPSMTSQQSGGASRFDDFIKQKETSSAAGGSGGVRPVRAPVKKMRKKEISPPVVRSAENANTLNSFLMMRPPAPPAVTWVDGGDDDMEL